MTSSEHVRLVEAREGTAPWKRWGPYLSERQWGTVREDYSRDGNAWEYFPHDHARSRAYRFGEDGIAGISDEKAHLCFGLALWNGNDPILKERLFGLTNSEGNHGEDVKEYYFYLDSTPTHSYMKYLYKYPQRAYPYNDIVETNRNRTRGEWEYELLDTGVFEGDRYFDVFVEYAKGGAEDVLVRVTAHNRGPEWATLHLLPTLWYRNTWWRDERSARPRIARRPGDNAAVSASHPEDGDHYLLFDRPVPLLFTNNETNSERLFGTPNATPFVKDGIDRAIVRGESSAVNPDETGTKVAGHYALGIEAHKSVTVCFRLTRDGSPQAFGAPFDALFQRRIEEADEFYDGVLESAPPEQRPVARQALAGMLWTKQYYSFDVNLWLSGRGIDVLRDRTPFVRNVQWFHMINDDVISMPDKWEYPWYAAWDLAFHCIPLSMVDPDFAKGQLELFLNEVYQHPNGQLPAYEWAFGDVNPPVHAFAVKYVYDAMAVDRGERDVDFLERSFQKLLLNFTWWVNRKDREGKNVFEGGFLGLDNIGVFDRSSPAPLGGTLEQADGTAWMAFYCLSMLEIAIELAVHKPVYEDMVVKFVEHFAWISAAMLRQSDGRDSMWDEADGFFYDVLRMPDGSARSMRIRSLVGLLPICATLTVTPETLARVPGAGERARRRIERVPALKELLPELGESRRDGRVCFTIVDEPKLRRVLERLFDENEFFGPFGIRSLSKFHESHPFTFNVDGNELTVRYLPAESDVGTFGGNSNWRGPVWFPMNTMIARALLQLYRYYGDDYTIECPTGSGNRVTLFEAARELNRRLISIFMPDAGGRRPVNGGSEKFQTDPHWRDHVLFYEYFHGDNGAGLGASHQTGWTGLVAFFMTHSRMEAKEWFDLGREALMPS